MSKIIVEDNNLPEMTIGKNVNRKLLWTSLLMIFAGAVIASKFDSWYAIGGGAVMAVIGCYLNQESIKWLTEEEGEKKKG